MLSELKRSMQSHKKVTTSATLANITQAERMTEVAVVIYARDIRIGKVRNKGMSEISETEIYSMTKEQNYMRGYKDGKNYVLDKIRAEIEDLRFGQPLRKFVVDECLEIIDKYREDT